MVDRPILFSGAMVRALLAGTKTQTRRVLSNNRFASIFNGKWADSYVLDDGNADWRAKDIRFAVGDRLYVREAWRCNGWASDLATIFYRASEDAGYTAMCEQYPVAGKASMRVTGTWRPGIHMPRWASRLTLPVTDVRVQRLQDISEADAIAEGCRLGVGNENSSNAVFEYASLWDHINGNRPGCAWADNPWIVAVSFTVERRNIDEAA